MRAGAPLRHIRDIRPLRERASLPYPVRDGQHAREIAGAQGRDHRGGMATNGAKWLTFQR